MKTARTTQRSWWILAAVVAGLAALLLWIAAFFPGIGPLAR